MFHQRFFSIIASCFLALLVSCAAIQQSENSATDIQKWPAQKQNILYSMQQVMGPLPSFKNLPAFDVRFEDSVKYDHCTRYSIKLTVAENEALPAFLFVPRNADAVKKCPAILALHGTSALGKKSISGETPKLNRAYAKELAERGYVVIAPDYPGFGGLSNYNFDNDRYVSGSMKGIFNHIRSIDFLETLPYVDKQKISVIGHSLGGHNALFLAAFDERAKIVVSSSGWTLFDFYNAGEKVTKQHGGRLGPWAQKLYMPLIKDKYDLDAKKIPFDFDEVIATLAPRIFYNNSPVRDANFDVNGVKKGLKEAKKIYKLFNAENNIIERYPDDIHNFPVEIRKEVYKIIDSVFEFIPKSTAMFD